MAELLTANYNADKLPDGKLRFDSLFILIEHWIVLRDNALYMSQMLG